MTTNLSGLTKVYKKHGIYYSDTELLVSAFRRAQEFTNWDEWFGEVPSVLGNEAAEKLSNAAAKKLVELGPEAEGFGVIYATPERAASIWDSPMVPIAFLDFLVKRGSQGNG